MMLMLMWFTSVATISQTWLSTFVSPLTVHLGITLTMVTFEERLPGLTRSRHWEMLVARLHIPQLTPERLRLERDGERAMQVDQKGNKR